MKIRIAIIVVAMVACSKDPESQEPIVSYVPQVQSSATYSVIEHKNITYAQGQSRSSWTSSTNQNMDLKLDVFEPDNQLNGRPAVLLIHGGGFIGGSKEALSMVDLARYLAERGFVCASINYRLLSDFGTVPDEWTQFALDSLDPISGSRFLSLYPASRDAKAALRWFYANASNYAIDTAYISVGGGSAGAYLSVMLGTTEDSDYNTEISTNDDPTLLGTNLGQKTDPKAILDFWGSALNTEVLDRLYGINRFGTNDAPILIMHGTEDSTVLYSEALALETYYQNSGVSHQLISLQGAGHGPWSATYNGKSLKELSFDFLVQELGLELK